MSASEKTYALEGRLDTLVSDGWVSPFYAEKSADQGRGGQTLLDDPDLTLSVPGPATYLLRAYIIYHGGTGVSEGDLRWAVTIGSGFLRYGPLRKNIAGNPIIGDMMQNATSNTAGTNGTANSNSLHLLGNWSISAAGTATLTFQWCKDTAADGTTNTTVEQRSYLSLERVTS